MRSRARIWSISAALGLAVVLVASIAPISTATKGPIGDWRLNGSLRNAAGTGLRMTKLGTPQFEVVDVAGTNKTALVFEEGEGLRLSRIPSAARRTYSIDVFFEFDAVVDYRRILSFGANIFDRGLYIDDGYLDLYPRLESAATVAAPDQWLHVLVTRNGATRRMKAFVDGVEVISILDTGDKYLLRNGIAVFFQDDANGEHPSGTVSRIKVFDRVLQPS
jgi:hypothetical protein